MKHLCLLSLTLLALAGSARAQAPAAAVGPLQPVQAIALGPHAAFGGAVQLANKNTVVLLTDADNYTLKAKCLTPEGTTAWETDLARYQHLEVEGFSVFSPFSNVAIGQNAKQDKARLEQRVKTLLQPVNVYTNGNQVLTVEYISHNAVKHQPKGSNLLEGQIYVQRLDENGQVVRAKFEPRADPESRKTKDELLGRYADADGFVELVRETNKRQETLVFVANHFDMRTKTVRREVIAVPPTPEHVGGMNSFRHWYQEWAYLGHRPNQIYFCRRTLTDAANPKEKAGRQPLTYQVYVADDNGAAAPGGFSTTLGLSKGTAPSFSGYMPSAGELEHIPALYTQSAGKNNYITYDEWSTSTGGVGNFYLDHGTGDVLVFGEYAEGDLPEADLRPDLAGYFARRYGPNGQVLAQTQLQYTAAFREGKRNADFKGNFYRSCRFHLDPLDGHSQFSFSPMRRFGAGDDVTMYFDNTFKMLRSETVAGKKDEDRAFTAVYYTEPYWLDKASGIDHEIRIYEHAAKTDLPLYAALEKLRRTVPAKVEDVEFHLSPTGPGTGLVLARKQTVGGTLQVYKF
jgi:hypothetical protein